MKKTLIFSIFCVSLLVCASFVSCKKKSSVSNADDAKSKELIVYTYDSFSGEWGPGPEIARLFKEKTGITVTYKDCQDGVEVLTKAILEKNNPVADVLIGLDNNLAQQAEDTDLFLEYKPSNASVLIKGMSDELNGKKWILTPYDYSHFAFIYNTQSDVPAPTCLEDLTKDIYKKKVILMDSRTSTVGLGFDCWVKAVYGDKSSDYMSRLEKSVLTVSPGWSVGYGMFTDGEAPLVISYTTSPAYHVEYGEGDQFKALEFSDGHVMQVEGAAILKSSKNVAGAKKFIDFLISEDAQNIIPLTQWMFPINKNVKLPDSYKTAALIPAKTLKY